MYSKERCNSKCEGSHALKNEIVETAAPRWLVLKHLTVYENMVLSKRHSLIHPKKKKKLEFRRIRMYVLLCI